MRASCFVGFVMGLSTAACGGRARDPDPMTPQPQVARAPAVPAAGAPPTPSDVVKEFSCSVSVEALGATYEGRAQGKGSSSDQFHAAAEADACKKLFDATKLDCHDDASVLASTKALVKGGIVTNVVRLTTVAAVQSGSGSSEAGGREACFAAVETACKTAPARSKCGPNNVSCEADATGKNWSCAPIRRDPFRGEALVPVDLTLPADPFADI